MRVFRPILKQMVVTAVLGFVIHKLMASNDPRAQRIGDRANKLVGGAFGPDERPQPRRRVRRAAGSAATVAAGGAIEYFFDPVQGAERRAKVKRFASERVHRNGDARLLPSDRQIPVPVPSQAIAPGVAS